VGVNALYQRCGRIRICGTWLVSYEFAKNIGDLSARRIDVGKHPLTHRLGVAGAGEDSDDDSLRVAPGAHDDHPARVGYHRATLTVRRIAGVNVPSALTQC
jgi:hypothetical protein